jgi:hypothetical protein
MVTEQLRYRAISQPRARNADVAMVADEIDLDLEEFELKASLIQIIGLTEQSIQ